jgi:hypothetical protein
MTGTKNEVFPVVCQIKTLPVVLNDTRIHYLLCVDKPVDKIRKGLR